MNHSRSVPASLEMYTSPEYFTLEICTSPEFFYSGHVLCMKHSRMCTSPEYFTPDMYLDERLQECSSLFRDVHKSRVIYSGHVLWMRLSRSVPACLKMCTSPEHFNPHMMYLDKTLQECSSISRDVHKSKAFDSRDVHKSSILLRTCTFNETLQDCSSMFGDVHKFGAFYSGLVLCMKHSRSVPACL
jgi:hypothetical protein